MVQRALKNFLQFRPWTSVEQYGVVQSMAKRVVFFVSDSTGITAEKLGRSLMTQFQGVDFTVRSQRFVDTEKKAQQLVTELNRVAKTSDQRPIVFSTLVNPELRELLAGAPCLLCDFLQPFLQPLEAELKMTATPRVGRSHAVVFEDQYAHRMEAVNYSLQNDDGGSIRQYEEADLVLVGVSRSGKTPTCLYLALHYGLYVANFPLVDEDLEELRLPKALQQHREKLFGLSISAERLHQIRTERQPGSRYASLKQCRYETSQVDALFRNKSIPHLDVTVMSVEEIATTILNRLGA